MVAEEDEREEVYPQIAQIFADSNARNLRKSAQSADKRFFFVLFSASSASPR